MSYPPLITPHFNPDGNNRFRSKLQILVFVPSLIFILILFVVLIYPLITQDTISTTMEQSPLAYGIPIINNQTHKDSIPISPTFSKLYRLFGEDSLIEPTQMNTSVFFDQLSLDIKKVSDDFKTHTNLTVKPQVRFSI